MAKILSPEAKIEIANHIYQYAVDNYPTKRGQKRWDIVVETMELNDIIERFIDEAGCNTANKAYAEAHRYAKLMAEVGY